jgi:hypothetical protein
MAMCSQSPSTALAVMLRMGARHTTTVSSPPLTPSSGCARNSMEESTTM